MQMQGGKTRKCSGKITTLTITSASWPRPIDDDQSHGPRQDILPVSLSSRAWARRHLHMPAIGPGLSETWVELSASGVGGGTSLSSVLGSLGSPKNGLVPTSLARADTGSDCMVFVLVFQLSPSAWRGSETPASVDLVAVANSRKQTLSRSTQDKAFPSCYSCSLF